jgi:signal transduction histidine kinase
VEFERETQREFLRNVEDEADKLEGIVDNLLDLSRMESRQLRLERQPVDLRGLALDVAESMMAHCPQHRFAHDLPPEPLVALADAGRMEQVLRNLLDNAIKYSPGGGTVSLQGRRRGGRIVIRISDEGIGIPPQALDRIFERFFRVPNEATQAARGAGLGLAVCQGIVEMHGGQIWADSREGEGSTFSFTLPAHLEDGLDHKAAPGHGGSA